MEEWFAALRHMRSYVAPFLVITIQIAMATALTVVSWEMGDVFIGSIVEGESQMTGHEIKVRLDPAVRGEPGVSEGRCPEEDRALLLEIPGVEAVSVASTEWRPERYRTYTRRQIALEVTEESRVKMGEETEWTYHMYGDEHVFNTMGIELEEGRPFTREDVEEKRRLAVISTPLKRRLFPGGALGRHLEFEGEPHKIIGVASPSTFRSNTLWVNGRAAVLPGAPLCGHPASLVLRVDTADPDGLKTQIKQKLLEADAKRAVMVKRFSRQSVPFLKVQLVGVGYNALSIVAVLGISMLGIVAVNSFLIRRRKRDIGIRRALGATRKDILLWFLRENIVITFVGTSIGVIVSYVVITLMKPNLPEMDFSGWRAVGSVLLFWAVCLASALLPANRAASVPPIEATRG